MHQYLAFGPDLEDLAVGAKGHVTSVGEAIAGTNEEGADGMIVEEGTLEIGGVLAGGQVPQRDALLDNQSGQGLAVRTESNAGHRTGVPFEGVWRSRFRGGLRFLLNLLRTLLRGRTGKGLFLDEALRLGARQV